MIRIFSKDYHDILHSFLISYPSIIFQATGYLKRADTDQLRTIFDKYATAKIDGETYMTEEDFLVGYLKFFPEKDYNKESAKVLCGILDQRKDG